jgi:two-component system cell cycle response regulator DivK
MIPLASNPVVLIVDRDPDTRQMYAEYLRLAHFDVDEAEEGREALAKALTDPHDVIIMDTRLPGIDGYKLLQILRRDPGTLTVPIIVVTGEGASSAIDRAWEAGANAVLVKPAMPDAVLAEVRRLLEVRMTSEPRAHDAERQGRTRSSHILSHAYQRGETNAPPIQPPQLVCPRCDTSLSYLRSYVGGVSAKHSEQWDEYDCPNGCGSFQYRQRTRKIQQC